MNFIKKVIFLFVFILFGFSFAYSQAQIADGVAAVVENEPILYSDINSLLQYYIIQNRMNPNYLTKEKIEKLQNDILTQLINSKVLAFEAQRESIQVKSDRISSEVDRQIDALVEQMGDKQVLIEQLKQEGMDIVQFRNKKFKQVRDQFYQMSLKQKLMNEIDVNSNKVKTFFETYKDSFPSQEESYKIAVYLGDLSPSAQKDSVLRTKLLAIRKEITSGKISFEDAAKKYSEGPSKVNGGDLGFFGKGSMVPQFEKVAFSLSVGEVSNIVKTQFGYHLIKVIDRDGAKIRARHILLQYNFSDSDYAEIKNSINKKVQSLNSVDSVKNLGFNEVLKFGWYQKGMLSPLVYKHIKENSLDSINRFFPVSIESGKLLLIYFGGYKQSRKISLKDDYALIEQKAKEFYLNQLFTEKINEWKKNFYIKIFMKGYKEN